MFRKYFLQYEIKDLLNKLIYKLKSKQHWNYSIKGILFEKKNLSPCTIMDRFERLKRIIKNSGQSDLNGLCVKNKSVYELGCGPLLGYGPFFNFLGSKLYIYDEPFINQNTLRSNEIKKLYFLPLFEELKMNYQNNFSSDEFYESTLRNSLNGIKNYNDQFDTFISNSVIEHIPKENLIQLFEEIYKKQKKGGYFLHAVDFGSHGKYGDGFGNMYSHNKKKVFEKIPSLNLLRKSEVKQVFEKIGWKILSTIVYRKFSVNRKKIDSSWSQYSDEDLESKVVIFYGRKL